MEENSRLTPGNALVTYEKVSTPYGIRSIPHLSKWQGEKPKPDQFIVFSIRTSASVVMRLYQHSDKYYKGKVQILTDKIINEYIDIHSADPMLTTYIGENKGKKDVDRCYKYNLQIRKSTLDRLNDMAEDFQEPKASIAKAALRIWILGLK